MDTWEKASLDDRRHLLLEEIRTYRYVLREHCLGVTGQMGATRRSVLNVGRKMQLVPTIASFAAGLLRGRSKSEKGAHKGSGVFKNVLSLVLGGYALLKILR